VTSAAANPLVYGRTNAKHAEGADQPSRFGAVCG